MFLVVGATGTLGGSIAKKLLQAGERVRVLVRGSSPARAHGPHTDPEELRQAGAEVVSGDLRDPESLRRAAQGVRVVVSTASGTKRAPPDTTGAVDGEGTANLAAAATEAGVARFVLVSAAGAGEGAPASLLQDKWRGEEALRASGVPHAILRPARFMGDWIGFLLGAQLAGGGGVVELVGDAEKPSSFVDEPDVAEVAARLARDPGSGPAEVHALSAERATYPELVERVARLLGAPLSLRRLPLGAEVTTVAPELAPVITRLATIHAMMPAYDAVDTAVADRYGVRLTGVDDYLRRAFAPQPA